MSESGPAPRSVAIAGVSGFVGRALVEALGSRMPIIGLGRGDAPRGMQVAEWRKCDLFSLLDAENALRGADLAVYLVHSMLPSATLSQGNFEDFDLIAADNFARGCAKNGVRKIVYLGGLVPGGAKENLSKHLQSRLEVERALSSHGAKVTALRAGMIIGTGGSSFEMLMRLVERLPWMLTPQWTETKTQPIALSDVVKLIIYCIESPSLETQAFDIGGPEVLTYKEMIARAAAVVGKKPTLIPVPLFSPSLSRLWVSLITGAPKSLVAPLVQSLKHEMIADDRRLQEEANLPGLSFEESVGRALAQREARTEEKQAKQPKAYASPPQQNSDRYVRSVQRLALPNGKNAKWAGEEYLRWLPRVLPFLFKVQTEGDTASFRMLGVTLLVLVYARDRSTEDRGLFFIRGGALARAHPLRRGRFEFRTVPGAPFLLSAVHDFEPALPWIIYAYTQAIVHLWVMRAFGRHLRRD